MDYGTTWVLVPERNAAHAIAHYTLDYPYKFGDADDEALALPALELACLPADKRHQATGIETKTSAGLADWILDSLDEYPIDLLVLVAFANGQIVVSQQGDGFSGRSGPAR